MKLSVIVPCFNEEDGLDQLRDRLQCLEGVLSPVCLEFVLVDDGSSDKTFEGLTERFAESPQCTIVRHEKNQGITAAIMTGARNAKHEWVATIDADCTYDPVQIQVLLNAITDNTSMVTASPYHPRGEVVGIPRWRLFLSKAASSLYRALIGVPIHTYTSCFRVCRRDLMLNLPIRENGFVGVAEMLWQLRRNGACIVEAPARLTSRRIGFSKMRTIPVILAHLRLMARIGADRMLHPNRYRSIPKRSEVRMPTASGLESSSTAKDGGVRIH